MAHPIDFPGSNFKFVAPPNREDISDLHTFRNEVCNVTCWQLTPAELEEIIRTGCVWVNQMIGMGQMQPLFVGSESVTRSVVVDYGKIW